VGSHRTKQPQARKLGQLSAADLLRKSLPPVRYLVPDYIAEGLTVLAGRPKLGKSWLALDIAIGVATGGATLGSKTVEQGDVLYLALEDNERRLQKRLLQLLPPSEMPERLAVETECPRLDQGGIEAIRQWTESVPSPRLVVVDVFNKVRPESKRGESLYKADYDALDPLKKLADEKSLAILIVHHTRKQEAEDPFDTVSGTTGFTGAADTVLVLQRSSQGTTLYARGRDIEEVETAVEFNKQTGRWSVLGAAVEVRRSDERSLILEMLKVADEPMSPSELASATRGKPNNIRQLLFNMAKAGEVTKLKGRGKYVHPNRCDLLETNNFDNAITEGGRDDDLPEVGRAITGGEGDRVEDVGD
jgi:predicted ATP-dependent serine protease